MLRLLSIGALLSVGIIGSTQAQTYVFDYSAKSAALASDTFGSFTLEKTDQNFKLTNFSGKVNDIQYYTPQVSASSSSYKDRITVGGVLNGFDSVNSGTNDFLFSLNPEAFYTDTTITYTSSTSVNYFAATASFKQAATPVTSAVPEPASWAMMIGGFGMIGAAARNRRRQRATVRLA